MRDYEERAYDVKRANGYWQLGRLGPENENVELLAKVREGRGCFSDGPCVQADQQDCRLQGSRQPRPPWPASHCF